MRLEAKLLRSALAGLPSSHGQRHQHAAPVVPELRTTSARRTASCPRHLLASPAEALHTPARLTADAYATLQMVLPCTPAEVPPTCAATAEPEDT